MKPIKAYPKRVQRNLDLIEGAFYDSDKHMQQEIRLVVAGLRSLDFCVTHAMAGYPNISWSKSGTPSVDIASPLAQQLTQAKEASVSREWWMGTKNSEYEQFLKEVRQTNTEASTKLFELLDAFYKDRHTPVSLRLTLKADTWFSDFRLHCQGAKDAASLSEPEYIEWLQNAQAEMQAFAEFLCTKVAK